MIRDHLYVLAVPDLSRSGEIYREVLGFEVLEMGDPGWRLFEKDSCRIMAGSAPTRFRLRSWATIPISATWSWTSSTSTTHARSPGASRS